MRRTGVIFRGMVLTVLFLIAVIFFAEHTAMESGALTGAGSTVYTSVKVGQKDTLETIADSYNTGSLNDADYISAVRRINGMEGEKLYPGCYLTVIRYAD